jgi:hypothetical protein
MIIYIDNEEKICYIMAPKCGSNTISQMLNTNLHSVYSEWYLKNDDYTKIIIIRKDVIDRFLSGFYEDLFNNHCYDDMKITFNDYLLFLLKCYNEQTPNVNNLQEFAGSDNPVWYGNCSNLYKDITDSNGNFCSHIMSQKYAIQDLVANIVGKNVKIVELNDLQKILPKAIKKHAREKEKFTGIDVTNFPLCDIKKQKIIMSKENLNEEQNNIILKMYEEDIIFFEELQDIFITSKI